jgi:hypothetical protein
MYRKREKTGYWAACVAGLLCAAVRVPADLPYLSAPPDISLWYGDEQHFGGLGNPQPRINILGSVSPPAEVARLTHSLNSAPAKSLSMGVDLYRLASPGDFNIEIERSELRPGRNEVTIMAASKSGKVISRVVRVNYIRGRVWPLPYTINWSEVRRLQDVAEVMDGHWALTVEGVRTVKPYYDRVIAIGDMRWRDYEASTSVIFHKMFANEILPKGPPFSNHAHASLLLRWRGHENDGKQPRVRWYPTGALAMWRAQPSAKESHWWWHGGESGIIAKQVEGQRVEIGQRYILRARVETLPGPKTRYSIKSWQALQPDPPDWDLVGIDGENDVQSGSLLLVVHHSDVTFGNIEVRPL